MSYAQATCPIEAPAEATTATVDDAESPRARPRRRVGRPPIEDSIELVMPAQFYTPANEAWWPGEKRLMLAVLTDAIDILMKGPGTNGLRRQALYEETVSWVQWDDTEWPYSFVNVCDALGLDVHAARKTLARRLERVHRRCRSASRPAAIIHDGLVA